MKTKGIVAFALFLVVLIVAPAFADTIYVGVKGCPKSDYDTIQDAVDNAMPYDTIIVCPGTYDETVLVDFSGNTEGVTIKPKNQKPGATIVNGGFKIVSDHVTITGFKITGGNEDNGICVEISGDYATVEFNDITECSGGGIRINQTPYVFTSSDNEIQHNKIHESDRYGIRVDGTYNDIHHNDILDNAPQDTNEGGIILSDISMGGDVSHNKINGNRPWGINVRGDDYWIHGNQVCDGVFLQISADNIGLTNNIIVDPPGINDNGATNFTNEHNVSPATCPVH